VDSLSKRDGGRVANGGGGAHGVEQEEKGADNRSEPAQSAPGKAYIKDRLPKQGHGRGVGRTVEVAGQGELPLDLIDEVLFEVLARVLVMELRGLQRQKVSRRFAAAIRNVFQKMASRAMRRACDLDEREAVGDKAYEQVFKIPFIVSPPSTWIDRAYSIRDCKWRSGPLLHDSTSGMYSGWPASSANRAPGWRGAESFTWGYNGEGRAGETP
jgi:hypothetical protein